MTVANPPEAPKKTATAPAENPVDAALYEKNPESQRDNVRKLTLEELDELARRMTTENKTITEEIKQTVNARAEELLSQEDTDKRLTRLQNLVHLARLRGTKAETNPAIQGNKSVLLQTAAAYAKMIPYVGETLSGIIPTSWERMWLTFLSTPAAIGTVAPDGFLKTALNWMGGDSQRSLAELDVRDSLAGAVFQGESITFRSITKDEWAEFQIRKDKRSITDLAKTYVGMKRREHALDRASAGKPYELAFGVQDLLTLDETKTSVEQKRLKETEDTLKKNIQKNYNATSVDLADGATLKNGALTVRKDEIDVDGKPKAGTDAKMLLDVVPKLSKADEIKIVRGGSATLEWADGKKIVTLPVGTDVNVAMINGLAAREKPKGISIVSIENSDLQERNEIVRMAGTKAKLIVPNDPVTLERLLQGIGNLTMPEDGQKDARWTLKNNEFLLVTKSFPVRPTV